MGLVILLCMFAFIWAENIKWISAEDFGACNYTDFVADAVGRCEKKFYSDLATDLTADCRTCYSRMEVCFTKSAQKCLEGHLSEGLLEHLINITLLVQNAVGSSQWYCSNRPMNTSSLDPNVRKLIPCSDEMFIEGHQCTKGFRGIFNAKRNDPRLCRAFSHARHCTQSVFNRYCKLKVPVPTSNQFNPFCHDANFHQETKVGSQAPKRSTNATQTRSSKPQKPAHNYASHTSKFLSRILGITVGVVNLKATARGFGLS